jgi:hypothetical protein
MEHPRFRSLVLIASTLGLAHGNAVASPLGLKPKVPAKAKSAAKISPETYAATEASGGAAPDTLDDESSDFPKPRQVAGKVAEASEAESLQAPESAPVPESAPAAAPEPTPAPALKSAAPADRGAYDPVPSNQRASIAKRLKIVERLILEHGRAYDYRIHTLAELELLLRKLEKKASGPQSSQDL